MYYKNHTIWARKLGDVWRGFAKFGDNLIPKWTYGVRSRKEAYLKIKKIIDDEEQIGTN